MAERPHASIGLDPPGPRDGCRAAGIPIGDCGAKPVGMGGFALGLKEPLPFVDGWSSDIDRLRERAAHKKRILLDAERLGLTAAHVEQIYRELEPFCACPLPTRWRAGLTEQRRDA